MHKIIQNEMISANVGRMVVEAAYVAEKRKAGQFIILRIDEKGERVPLTIADADPSKGTITLFLPGRRKIDAPHVDPQGR